MRFSAIAALVLPLVAAAPIDLGTANKIETELNQAAAAIIAARGTPDGASFLELATVTPLLGDNATRALNLIKNGSQEPDALVYVGTAHWCHDR